MAESLPTRTAMGARSLLFSLFLILLVFSGGQAARAAGEFPVAEIVRVEAPSAISPNEDFTVLVVVDYSGRYSTDIAILDATTGFVLATKGLIIPAGRNLFTFQLAGHDQLGLWTLMVAVRVWWHDGWYMNQKGATFPFEITIVDSSNASLVIMSNVALSTVTVDGVSHVVSSEGIQLSTRRGMHTIEAEPSRSAGNGTRIVFDHWSDGVHSLHREIYLTGRLDLSAIYITEYLLTVKSDLGETVGSGWYTAGTNATFGVTDPALTGDLSAGQVTYKFSGWSGNSDSSSPVNQIIMDGPKTVLAHWSEDPSQATLAFLLELASLVFLGCSVILIALGAVLRNRGRHGARGGVLRREAAVSRFMLAVVLLAALAHSSVIQPVDASGIFQPATVAIGDATWYHWNQARSDTLLIWLGGGIVEATRYLVNPYEFESYNTIYFIQDLSRHYDVLALKKGSLRYQDVALNRTFFREPYPTSNDFIKGIRSWSYEHEYTYLYIVGYSVGAMAAAQELVLAHPEDWTSPDGLIIITTKFSEGISLRAGRLRASLLLLYGDKVAPEFTTSGQTFFEHAPDEGWRDGFRFHKEFHVIPDVEHEVWTIKDTGEYDSRAILLTVKFIETCKGLQFERATESVVSAALNQTSATESTVPFEVHIVSVSAPAKIMTSQAFAVAVEAQYSLPPNRTVAVVTLDRDTSSIVSASERRVGENGETQLVNIILSGERARQAHLSLVPLIGADDEWRVVADGVRDVVVQVTDSFSVTVIMRYADIAVQFDGQTFQTGANGDVSINSTRDEHLISTPLTITFDNKSRAIFRQWNTTASSSNLPLSISSDVCLLAIYQTQYYLDATSPLGEASGSGWYDEGSIAHIQVEPVLVSQGKTYVFAGWAGDSSDSAPASSILMNSPKNAQASWRELTPGERNMNLLPLYGLFATSLAILLGSLLFACMSLRQVRRARGADISDSELGYS